MSTSPDSAGETCVHAPYECHRVSYPWRYAVTRQEILPDGRLFTRFIRWSDDGDPQFPCLCECGPCEGWRQLKADVDGPVILPAE